MSRLFLVKRPQQAYKKKASLLIESILLEVPIPVLYFAEEVNGKYSVIDGQQRLTSFLSFVDEKFPIGKGYTDFTLSGLDILSEIYQTPKPMSTGNDSEKASTCASQYLGRTLFGASIPENQKLIVMGHGLPAGSICLYLMSRCAVLPCMNKANCRAIMTSYGKPCWILCATIKNSLTL